MLGLGVVGVPTPIVWRFLAADQRAALLFIEPEVFEAPAIVDAVDHDCQTLDPGLPAGAAGREKDHRGDRSFRQYPFELPDDLLALFRIGLHRLLIHEFL